MAKPIGVGIIGLSPGRSWAAMTIVPGVRALPDYKLVACSTTRMETASACAKEFDIPHAFDNHKALVNHPDVDLVVVSVKVPHHFELTTAAIESGKHVYTEWPLGNGLEEAEKLAALARKKGVKAAVGLQGRGSRAINYIRDLVAEGYVGKVLSTSIVTAGVVGSTMLPSPNAYTADIKNGATMLTIGFGHSFDAVLYALQKEVRELNATTAVQTKSVKLIDTGGTVPMTAEDQLVVGGLLDDGVVFSAHYYGGMAHDPSPGFSWLIHGTTGSLRMTLPAAMVQIAEVTIHGTQGNNQPGQVLPVPDKYKIIAGADGDAAQTMAHAFQRFANDIKNGTATAPTFDDAVVRQKLIHAIQDSAKSGKRMTL
jgi:predicted dehydrogenase